MELPRLLDDLLAKGATYADVRHQKDERASVEWRDGETRKAVPGAEEGWGVRVLADGAWGLAATSREDKVRETAEQALAIAKAVGARLPTQAKVVLAPVKAARGEARWRPRVDPRDVSLTEKAAILREAGDAARLGHVSSVRAAYEDVTVRTRFVSTDGADLSTEVVRSMVQLEVAARRNGQVVGYRTRIGGTLGWELVDVEDVRRAGREAGEGANRVLDAKPCPAGRMPVITDPDLTGVFAHEAIGHACEADLVLAGESILAGRIGEDLGNPQVTIVDDGTVPSGFGSLPYDDEGVPAGRKALLTKGVLAGYIHSRETAGRLGMEPNGGARAESYGSMPMVRMSNTLVEPGGWELDEMLKGVKRGILAKGTRGGQVDCAKGSFQFSAQEAFLIEKGEITTPLRDVSLSGDILTTLKRIDAVGRDARLASPGICGKGQWVPVGDGGPHLRIAECRVGGSA